MSTDASVLSALEQPHCRICQRFDPQVGPDLAKALSNLTGTKGSAVTTGLECSYNSKDQTIIFPRTIVTADGKSARLGPYNRRVKSELRKGVITGEAWAIGGACGQVSHSPYSDIVLMTDAQGELTECADTVGKLASYKGQTCMELYGKRHGVKEQKPFAYIIPDTRLGDAVTDQAGGEREGWSIKSIRGYRAPEGESSAGPDTDGVDSALSA